MEVFGDLQTKPNRDHNFKSPSMQQVYASDRFIYTHHLQSRQDLTFCRKQTPAIRKPSNMDTLAPDSGSSNSFAEKCFAIQSRASLVS